MTFNIAPKLMIVICAVYAVFVFSIFPAWTVDDAFITYRYAEHLAQNGELNWNVGADPVEGYTGIVLPTVLAGFIKLGASPIMVSRSIGIVSFFLSLWLLFVLLRELKIHPIISGSTLLIFGTIPVLFTHATSGLETMLFVSAMLFALYTFIRSKTGFLFFWSLLFVSLVRPEGVLFAGLLFLAAAASIYRTDRTSFVPFLIRFCAAYFLPALA